MTDEKKQVRESDMSAKDVSLSPMTNREPSPYVPEGASPRPWSRRDKCVLAQDGTYPAGLWGVSGASWDIPYETAKANYRLIALSAGGGYERACELLEAMRECALGVMPEQESELTEQRRDLLDECDRAFAFLQSAREQAAEGGGA